MNDKSETRVQQKIDSVDETPVQWRAAGILFVGLTTYSVTFGLPFPEPFAPSVTFTDIAGTPEIGFAIPFLVILSWGLGIYMGHVMHKIFGADPA